MACLEFDSLVGRLSIRADDDVVTEVKFDGSCDEGRREGGSGNGSRALCEQARAEIEEFLAGEREIFTVPFRAAGTDFQQAVWWQMCQIGYGATRTYGELAAGVGEPGAGQAVGLACGANPIPLIIPCHRVVAANGLGGFGGGVDRKVWLLGLEQGQGRLC